MAESEVVKAINKQRAEIARNELDALRRMTRLWVPGYKYLKEQAEALAAIIKKKRDAGEPIEPEYIFSHQRYKTMMDHALDMIDQYNKAAAGLINGKEVEMANLGIENAKKIVNIAEPDDPMWTRVNKRETRIMAGMTAKGSPLSELLNKSFPETKARIEEKLIIGIATGQGSSWIAQQMTDAANVPLERALVIARTEINRAYRQSNLEQMRSSRAILGYRRMCYKDTACLACLMLDGEFYDKLEEFSDHPNGKCSAVPVTKHFDPINDPNWERGPEWFARQDEETQRKLMGAGRFELWKQQGVNPRDMVWIKPNPVWGGSPTVKTLEDLNNNYSFRPISRSDRSMANGLRKPPSYLLSDSEIKSLKEDIAAINADESVFSFNTGKRTGYVDSNDTIHVRGDVLPDLYSKKARDRMSSRAVLAHEYYGHRAHRGTILPSNAWNDEFRASYMAAKNAPGLSDEDRYYLIQDAVDRALEHGIKIRYNKFMNEALYGKIHE